MHYIKSFEDISIDDIPFVGGKNASLGQMIRHLQQANILVPLGFAITTRGYHDFLEHNQFTPLLKQKLKTIVSSDQTNVIQKVGKEIRALLHSGTLPKNLADEIVQAYHLLSSQYDIQNVSVAVRSSATAEDLPGASFAGQQESFLNVIGVEELLKSCVKAYASLFTDRAIVYRIEKGFEHLQVGLSIGIQKMVHSDSACAGVAFSLDPETGFRDVVTIDASYGLGESVVKGSITPDEFVVHKPTLAKNYRPIIQKYCGSKTSKIICENSETKTVTVSPEEQKVFSLTDDEILLLARQVVAIEDHYSSWYKKPMPMDIEWAKDGNDQQLYIVQARPETVHAIKEDTLTHTTYHLDEKNPTVLLVGQSIGQQITHGTARILDSPTNLHEITQGDVIVTTMTNPDWVPIMRRAAGIITDEGGRTCHAAIVARELGIPAIIGTRDATKKISDKESITIDCSQGQTGLIYQGHVPFSLQETRLDLLEKPPVSLMINIADPSRAFTLASLPVDGVGLARIEFIITNHIKIHPMLAAHEHEIKDKYLIDTVRQEIGCYPDLKSFFIQELAQGIATIAAAFYPKQVIVRMSDFKTNEYRALQGGEQFEPHEENPMLGFRGAWRYIHKDYQAAFLLECDAIKRVRNDMGLTNVTIMIPFVRTIDEAQAVIDLLAQHGLAQGKNDLSIIMMCEVPSNVMLIDDFSLLFDGFSIGSNDLTQLTLGIDRDSALLAHQFNEFDPALRILYAAAIAGAHRHKKTIGICGQGPSDNLELATFLIEHGIDSISLNHDSVIPFLQQYIKKGGH